jgi:hypothetical protein
MKEQICIVLCLCLYGKLYGRSTLVVREGLLLTICSSWTPIRLDGHAGLEEALHGAPHVGDAFPDVHLVPDPVLQAGQEVVTVEHRRELDELLLELAQLGRLVGLGLPDRRRRRKLLCILWIWSEEN